MDAYNPPKFIQCTIDNQLEIFDFIRNMNSFIFRGHADSEWHLTSSFEREYNKYPRMQMIEGAEKGVIEFFKKRAHLYGTADSHIDRLSDLLCTMQHYGCPTRLIDFTRSFYVATYFAVSGSHTKEGNYSIWAINHPFLAHKSRELLGSTFKSEKDDYEYFLQEAIGNPIYKVPYGVFPVDGYKISRRMSSQQGVLLFQSYLGDSFMENLCRMFSIENKSTVVSFDEFTSITKNIINDVYIVKFNFSKAHAQSVRKELLSLNITSENMFPDFNGLAKSSTEHIFWQY